MKKSSCDKLKITKRVLICVAAILAVVVFVLTVLSSSTITKSRADGEFVLVEGVSEAQVGNDREYRFTLGEIGHAETLAFFVNHHNVQVYVGDENVYTMTAQENDAFLTAGGIWVTVPLYEDDVGKEVRVVLTPLYDNYNMETPDFMLGSEIAIHNATLHRALPVIILSFCVIFAGLLLIFLGVYHSVKGLFVVRLYALGFMAISAGMWRISYDRVIYMLFEKYSLAVYTISIISLMAMALSMLISLEVGEKNIKFIRICSCVYCGVYIVQLALQIAGIADLRETLKLIHLTIVLSALAFMADGIVQIFIPKEKRNEKINFSWLLGVGVVVDLLLYYFAKTSINIVFTLIAILIYSVLEGIQLMFCYMEQRKALEEMETQLTLSRTTSMMSQIRSHFVFNILNAISGMCKYDPEMADDTVVRFARYLRNNIDIMEKDGNIPFKTDLRQLEDYVALEQVRFGDKLEFYTDIEVDDFMIPPLILQPVVENAIKHGVSKKQGDGTIILHTFKDDGKIVITVTDDGVGFDMAELQKEKSVGIRNIRFRLEHLVGGTFEIESEIGKGTTVTIKIPEEES